MSGGRRWEVFLAYASPDRDRARALYRALTEAGLSVFFDEAVLRPGDDWHRLLPEHLRASAMVVALASSHTPDAQYESDEVVRAVAQLRREGARLIPLRLDPDADLPYGTANLQALDYFDAATTPQVAAAIVEVARKPSAVPTVIGSQVWCGRIPGLRPSPSQAARPYLSASRVGVGERGRGTHPDDPGLGRGGQDHSRCSAGRGPPPRARRGVVGPLRAGRGAGGRPG